MKCSRESSRRSVLHTPAYLGHGVCRRLTRPHVAHFYNHLLLNWKPIKDECEEKFSIQTHLRGTFQSSPTFPHGRDSRCGLNKDLVLVSLSLWLSLSLSDPPRFYESFNRPLPESSNKSPRERQSLFSLSEIYPGIIASESPTTEFCLT